MIYSVEPARRVVLGLRRLRGPVPPAALPPHRLDRLAHAGRPGDHDGHGERVDALTVTSSVSRYRKHADFGC